MARRVGWRDCPLHLCADLRRLTGIIRQSTAHSGAVPAWPVRRGGTERHGAQRLRALEDPWCHRDMAGIPNGSRSVSRRDQRYRYVVGRTTALNAAVYLAT